jgi:hypothetical protein
MMAESCKKARLLIYAKNQPLLSYRNSSTPNAEFNWYEIVSALRGFHRSFSVR